MFTMETITREQKRVLKSQTEAVTGYFTQLIHENAMPVTKGRHQLGLADREIRRRARLAMHVLLEDGAFAGKDDAVQDAMLAQHYNEQERSSGYNPYRDAALSLLATLVSLNRLLKLQSQTYPDSAWVRKILRPVQEKAPLGLMHLYGKQLPQELCLCFPQVAQAFAGVAATHLQAAKTIRALEKENA